MKTKIQFSSLLAIALLAVFGCGGLKVGNLDLGKLAETSARVITGNKMSYQDQVNMGQQMTAVIVGSSKMLNDAKLQKYVNKVGKWVAMHSTKKHKKGEATQWQFIVIDSPDFNAFSMPGGYVVISSGIIDRLSSEAELAAVLAHEIAHVEQKHQVKAIEKSNRWSDIGELGGTAYDYKKSQEGGYNTNSLLNRQISEGILDATQSLYVKGLGRDDELDADRKAVVLMTRAGYDPYAYLSVMQIIESIDDKDKLLVLATHPKISERIHVAYNTLNHVDKYLDKTKVVETRFIKNVP